MRILHITKLYAPWIGGVEVVVQKVAEGLNSGDMEMAVLCCQPEGLGREDNVNGVRVMRASSLGVFWGMPVSLEFGTRLRDLSSKYDVFHFHLPFPLGVLAWLLHCAKDRENRIVVSYYSDIVRQKVLNPLITPMTQALLRRADAILVIAPPIAENSPVLRPFQKMVRLATVGVELQRFELTPQLRDESAALRKPFANLPILLFVGRLTYYKGLEVLITAMRNVQGVLWIVGQGQDKRKLQRLVEHYGLAPRVRFFSDVSDERLKAFYHACDVFVLPSIYPSEVFGIVQLEAMACGKPVINTDLPTGVPWVSIHNETGLTVPPGDAYALAEAITTLTKDAAMRQRFGNNARNRVMQTFTREKMLRDHNLIYEALSRGTT